MGADVTGNGTQLLDVTNATFFPQLSPFSNDMDMVATGAFIYAVPEPATLALCGAAGLGLALARWLRRREPALEDIV